MTRIERINQIDKTNLQSKARIARALKESRVARLPMTTMQKILTESQIGKNLTQTKMALSK